MNVDKFIRETLANKIEEAVAEIRKTILHPDNEPNVTLYPKTSIDQVEQLAEQLDYIKTNLIKDTLIGTDGIVIDKAADSEKIEISGKNFRKALETEVGQWKVYMSRNGDPNSYLWSGTEVLADMAVVVRGNNGCIYTNMPDAANTKDTTVPNKKYVDDAIASIAPATQTKWQHNIILEGTKDGFTFKAFLSICRSDDTLFGTFDEIVNEFRSRSIPCTGYVYDGTKYYSIYDLDCSGPVLDYLNPDLGEQMLEITNEDVTVTDDPIEF